MISYADWFFYAIGRDKGSKQTRLEVWKIIEESVGRDIVCEPDLSDYAKYLWDLFVELKSGCDHVTHKAIVDYQSLFNVELTAFEIELFIYIDKMSEINNA